MKQLVFYLLLLLAFIACKKTRDEPAPTRGTIEGTVMTVIDSANNISIPVKNVEILSTFGSKFTDDEGKFYFEEVKKGTYFISFSHDWYEARENIELTVEADKKRPLNILLKANTPILHAASDDFDSTNALNFGDEAVNLNFNLTNIGTEGELNWVINENDFPEWLSINQTEENGITTIEVVINRALLNHQSASDTIFIENTSNPDMTLEIPIVVNNSSTELIENSEVNNFITKWIVGDVKTIRLPLYESTTEDPTAYSFTVDWGDGSIEEVRAYDDPDAQHTYLEAGEKTVKISGTQLKGFNFSKKPTSKDLFVSVEQWGNIALGNGEGYFLDCSNISTFGATDAPNLSETTTLKKCFADTRYSGESTAFNGNLSAWDVSNITNMDSVFYYCPLFNANLSSWDVSNVSSMASMFEGAEVFNQDISSWDVKNVTNMDWMFSFALTFDQSLSSWDVSKVTSMEGMFAFAENFNQDISSWNVGNVTNMSSMFEEAYVFNQDISGWDVSKVTDMNWMFSSAITFNQGISSWDVSRVTDMSWMFSDALAFNQDISGWNINNVTTMEGLFSGANAFNYDISGWDISNVTSTAYMFSWNTTFNQDISTWDVSNVTEMSGMFYNASVFNQDISSWNVGNTTDMSDMFNEARAFNQDISSWDVSKVTNMNSMFYGASAFNQNISSWDVGKVKYMYRMFYDASVFSKDISSWNTINVTSCTDFSLGSALTTEQLPTLGTCF